MSSTSILVFLHLYYKPLFFFFNWSKKVNVYFSGRLDSLTVKMRAFVFFGDEGVASLMPMLFLHCKVAEDNKNPLNW